jgi:hypothetical protein
VTDHPAEAHGSVASFRVCDRRFPFLWASAAQPPARWHDAGEGPCHYLGSAPKVCWAEVLRHEEIRDPDDVEDLDCAMWVVGVTPPTGVPTLPHDVLTGDMPSYPACHAEAQRLRAAEHAGLRAPSAAVLSGQAEVYGVDQTGQHVTQTVAAEVIAIWSTTAAVTGSPIGHGTADPAVLADVRYL